MEDYPNLSKEEQEQANEKRKAWKREAVLWHNSIPNFDYDIRSSLTKDVQTIFNFEQLRLNKELFRGIKWNNILSITMSIVNLVLFVVNIILLIKSSS